MGSEVCDAGFGLREFGQAEVQNLDSPVFGDEKIFWLEVAMNDSFFMGRGQAMRDLQSIVESLAHGERSAAQTLAQGLALEQFGDDVRRALVRADVEYRQNVGMIQGSGGQSLLLKTAQTVGVQRKRLRQDFDRHFALETRITGAIDLAHAPRAQKGNNFVGTKFRSRSQIHSQARVSPQGTNRTSLTDADKWDLAGIRTVNSVA